MYFQKERSIDVRNADQLPPVSAPTGTETCDLLACGWCSGPRSSGGGGWRNLKRGTGTGAFLHKDRAPGCWEPVDGRCGMESQSTGEGWLSAIVSQSNSRAESCYSPHAPRALPSCAVSSFPGWFIKGGGLKGESQISHPSSTPFCLSPFFFPPPPHKSAPFPSIYGILDDSTE